MYSGETPTSDVDMVHPVIKKALRVAIVIVRKYKRMLLPQFIALNEDAVMDHAL